MNVNDVLNGIEEGLGFLLTFKSRFNLGHELVVKAGFSNLIVIIVLIAIIVSAYSYLKNTLLRKYSMGGSGIIIMLICMAFGWSGLATITIGFFYFWGSLTGVFIGYYNGSKIHQRPFIGIGVILGIVIGIILLYHLPEAIGLLIEISIVIGLSIIAYDEIIHVTKINLDETTVKILAVGGAISLVVFDPNSFVILLNEGSKITNIKVHGDVSIITILYYAPVAGWIYGLAFPK
jgi:hypothetical protein